MMRMVGSFLDEAVPTLPESPQNAPAWNFKVFENLNIFRLKAEKMKQKSQRSGVLWPDLWLMTSDSSQSHSDSTVTNTAESGPQFPSRS